ncbi:phosphoribosylformylglycinamidine cyclo-ligase [Thermodesulfovibrio yellowstonii]|uniref:Phosphoribosylformylglycinamidine cyclo-ligase n=1 Tax=Thermodesulfovibrio yellowstonii (strain ATCC 51303 / DSM 11347 / YP87) TaxID=289376 RepID=PUR5_THEYD|nr:phosphoribosylformylglycinamidine cyclo-ligase [Thermodesulfovibrio yellowstonii]B5YKG0.1 RecName: Full=Phosphoribosylformylglycinamidine cyclo-ligase; AltName: Full=AIR synthase; AltName: Full=AIRS; AltName: Full=Phosphoribosyl-aminoimidazole synthetase [Thermodesulfovibrio yellowstonii DSM 11347]ACI21011.1 phosphoribosylformylglycinamidine cyclo-ligase [Thermodesulfovibrio yellowstonii DSM 11347]MDI6865727.1 phosphoribosylformylglycinamidine cyclo-ligase [Thermodesulfovibrio yellowstonii]
MSITYKKAGVDIDEADKFVSMISPIVKTTFRKEVLTEIGLFAGLFKFDVKKYKEPVLVSGTDGVGTKLKIAFEADKHDTVGIDLVAMCVNDILTVGAEPLFFLDYFATGKLNAAKATEVIKGIVQGCKEAGCALIGGETAELPRFYKKNEYDLAGFAVGVVDRKEIIDGSSIKEGDVFIGVASSGLHSNGFSLARKVLFDIGKLRIDQYIPELNCILAKELLKPTEIYVKAYFALKDKVKVKGMAHITGGGIPGNLSRILPKNITAILDKNSWTVPSIFHLIKNIGKINEAEMFKVFNMGIGYIFVVEQNEIQKSLAILNKKGYKAYLIGKASKGGEDKITIK